MLSNLSNLRTKILLIAIISIKVYIKFDISNVITIFVIET
jgi:hypothetical protein